MWLVLAFWFWLCHSVGLPIQFGGQLVSESECRSSWHVGMLGNSSEFCWLICCRRIASVTMFAVGAHCLEVGRLEAVSWRFSPCHGYLPRTMQVCRRRLASTTRGSDVGGVRGHRLRLAE